MTDVVYSAFEVPCLDIQGKAVGRPVVDLLGGPVRDRVPFNAYLFYKFPGHIGEEPDDWGEVMTPDAMVEEARRFVSEHGFGSLKLKGGVLSQILEIETMLKLREAFRSSTADRSEWRLDGGYGDLHRKKLEGVLEYLEDPVLGMDAMAKVAAATGLPLATNMVVLEFDQLPKPFARMPSRSYSDHHYWGGIRASTHLATLCAAFGLGLSMPQLAPRDHACSHDPCCCGDAKPDLCL